MRSFLLFLLIGAILGEVYTFIAVRTAVKAKWISWVYLAISLIIIAYIIYSFTKFDRSVGQTKTTLFTIGLMLITVIPKMLIGIVLLGEDLFRIFTGCMRAFLGE